jgi:hypothetical protein
MYAGGMNTNLPIPFSGRILLLVTPAAGIEPVFEMVARLVERSPLYILDGGNIFQGYQLARILRRRTPDYAALLAQVLLSRVFTCYQMAALLSESTFVGQPVLMLDFLATFYDQNVRLADRRRLLRLCLAQLKRLSQQAPVAVWVRQRSLVPEEALDFLDEVQAAAGHIWAPVNSPVPAWQQAGLWGENPSPFRQRDWQTS